MPDALSNLSRLLSRVTLMLAAIGLCLMTAIIFWQVFARYVLQASPSWSEQAALLLMIWFIFLATAVGIREGFHIRITALTDALSPKARHGVEAFAHIVTGLIGLGMAIWGTQLTAYTWPHNIPTLGVSRGLAYIPVILSGAMIAFFSVEQLIAHLQGREVKSLWN